jgi:glycosyltransferase involved in cell wall biosynthesis
MKSPTISAAMRVYNAEKYIGQSLTAILSQTRPPDEVVVVDDGSTDETQRELRRFRGEIRLVKQSNGGYARAFNRSFSEARGDYIAICDADDIWEPNKLERQVDALLTHREIDIAVSAVRFFGLIEGLRVTYPRAGLLEPRELARRLYSANFVCTSSVLIRRRLYEQLGPFQDRAAPSEDYDYWLRALTAGAAFFYDPSVLVRYRAHAQQVSNSVLRMLDRTHAVHSWHSGVVEDAQLVRNVQARDLSKIARVLSDQNRSREARAVFTSSLRRRPTLFALAWVLILSAPDRYSRRLADRAVSVRRRLRPAAQR